MFSNPSKQEQSSTFWLGLIGFVLFFLPSVSSASYTSGGWHKLWSAEIQLSGCTLENYFNDVTATNNPSLDAKTYATNDPFKIHFLRSEDVFLAGKEEIEPGTLFVWIQPRYWEGQRQHHQMIINVSIGEQNLAIHPHAARVNETRYFYLAGGDAEGIRELLIAEKRVELTIHTALGGRFKRRVPLTLRSGRFRTFFRMLDACYEDRNP